MKHRFWWWWLKNCLGFHWFALLQTAKKAYQKNARKITCFYTNLLNKNNWKIIKHDVQNVPQNVSFFGGWAPWGAPGVPLAPQLFVLHEKMTTLCFKNDPKGSKLFQKWPQGFKMEAQKHPKRGTLSTKCFKVVQNSSKQLPTQIINWTTTFDSGPADCAKHFQ